MPIYHPVQLLDASLRGVRLTTSARSQGALSRHGAG
jgi:hypothetical protein